MDDEGLTIQEPVGARAVLSRQLTGDRYRLGVPIAKGGMGEIVAAEDTQVGRHVAIKRMLSKDPTDRAIARFIREAQIQGRLDHPSIVPVYEIGRDNDGRPFFVMKNIAGTTLADLLAKPALAVKHSQQKMLRAFVDVCLAIELAHTRGIVHRDLKPSNIMLGDFGEVYVLDWGVAKLAGVPDDEGGESSDDNLTLAGATVGTPGFMPPEQIRDASNVDARVDIYALGCVLFEILTHTPLHPRGRSGINSALAGADARAGNRAPERHVPPELEQLCIAATATDPAQRTITARELGDRVQEFLDGDRDLEHRGSVAREHLANARAALVKDDDETARAVAMREAGRAIALDPKLTGAAALITRLMLEPPKSLPREVERELEQTAVEADRRHARTSVTLVVLLAGFLPFLAISQPWWFTVSFALLLVAQALMLRREARSPRFRAPLATIRSVLLVAMIARAFSPFFLAPAIAAALTPVLMFSSSFARVRSAVLLAIALTAAIFLPYAAEATGLLSPTMHLVPGGVRFVTGVPHDSITGELGLFAFVLGVVGGGAVLAWQMLSTERALRRQLVLQTWQLKQLVL